MAQRHSSFSLQNISHSNSSNSSSTMFSKNANAIIRMEEKEKEKEGKIIPSSMTGIATQSTEEKENISSSSSSAFCVQPRKRLFASSAVPSTPASTSSPSFGEDLLPLSSTSVSSSSTSSPITSIRRSPTPHPQSRNFGLSASLANSAPISPTILRGNSSSQGEEEGKRDGVVLSIPSNLPSRVELLALYLQQKRERQQAEKKTKKKKPPFRPSGVSLVSSGAAAMAMATPSRPSGPLRPSLPQSLSRGIGATPSRTPSTLALATPSRSSIFNGGATRVKPTPGPVSAPTPGPSSVLMDPISTPAVSSSTLVIPTPDPSQICTPALSSVQVQQLPPATPSRPTGVMGHPVRLSTQDAFDACIQRAKTLYDSGDFLRALAIIKEMLRDEEVEEEAEEEEERKSSYQRFVKKQAKYWTLRALSEEALGNYSEVVRCFELASDYSAQPLSAIEIGLRSFLLRVRQRTEIDEEIQRRQQRAASASPAPASNNTRRGGLSSSSSTSSGLVSDVVHVVATNPELFPGSTSAFSTSGSSPSSSSSKSQKIYYRDVLVDEIFQQVCALSKFITLERPDETSQGSASAGGLMTPSSPSPSSGKFDAMDFLESSPSLRLVAAVPLFRPSSLSAQQLEEEDKEEKRREEQNKTPLRTNRRLRASMFGLSSPFLGARPPIRIPNPEAIPIAEPEEVPTPDFDIDLEDELPELPSSPSVPLLLPVETEKEKGKKKQRTTKKKATSTSARSKRSVPSKQKDGEREEESELSSLPAHDPGSLVVLTPMRASRRERVTLGSDVILTPVRRSARTLEKGGRGREGEDTIFISSTPVRNRNMVLERALPERVSSLLEEARYAYAPNPFLTSSSASNVPLNLKNEEQSTNALEPRITLLMRDAEEVKEEQKEAKQQKKMEKKNKKSKEEADGKPKRAIRSRRRSLQQ